MKSGWIKQRGRPDAPSLVIDKLYLAEPGKVAGLERFARLNKGERARVWYALDGRFPSAVAESEQALRALLSTRPPPPRAEADAPTPAVEVLPAPDLAPLPRAGLTLAAPLPRERGRVLDPRFHNPYNFVPFVSRRAVTPQDDEDVRALLDGPPPGHDRLRSDRWHGQVEVHLTLVTPLLLPDLETEQGKKGEHKSVDVLYRDGRPWLPGSSIKGALRSAFEAITNSRLPRFDRHEARLGYRRAARSALGLKGARVKEISADRLVLEIYKEAALAAFDGSVKGNGGALRQVPPLPYPSGERPQHGDQVWVELKEGKNNTWVSRIWRQTVQRPPKTEPGFVYATGQNINGKRSERVFYGTPTKLDLRGEELARLRAAWRDLVADYRGAHTESELHRRKDVNGNTVKADVWIGDKPGETAWSRHLWDDGWTDLAVGSLCHAKLSADQRRVEALYPVLISRELFPVAPARLVPDSHLPARDHAEFSPADRVFGWVSEARDAGREQSSRTTAPYRGHVRISGGRCLQDRQVQEFPGQGLPMAILSAPKPKQARFYVGRADGTAQRDGLTVEEAGHESGHILRGRKVYPFHKGAPAALWHEPMSKQVNSFRGERGETWHREYRRVPKANGEEQRDSQNRSVRGWVKEGATFAFTVHIDNLRQAELGALLVLLQTDTGWHLRFGGGKPYGFGSATLQITGGQLLTGDELRARYLQLGAPPPTDLARAVEDARVSFRRATQRVYGENPAHLCAFERAARGFDDARPVHYPRVRQGGATQGATAPTAEGESFKWFVENERLEGTRPRFGLALDDLVHDEGLPTLRGRR